MSSHKFKSLDGAVRRVRELERQVANDRRVYEDIISRRSNEIVALAKLAATGPAFFNPLEAFAAEAIRDRILRTCCKLKPDGSPLEGGK